ncbi:hypothetical protein P9112_013118 [Eukaryota sp. TZLM1-RC]
MLLQRKTWFVEVCDVGESGLPSHSNPIHPKYLMLDPLIQTLDSLIHSLSTQLAEVDRLSDIPEDFEHCLASFNTAFTELLSNLSSVRLADSLRELSKTAHNAALQVDRTQQKLQHTINASIREANFHSDKVSSFSNHSNKTKLRLTLSELNELSKEACSTNTSETKPLVSRIIKTIERVNEEHDVDCSINTTLTDNSKNVSKLSNILANGQDTLEKFTTIDTVINEFNQSLSDFTVDNLESISSSLTRLTSSFSCTTSSQLSSSDLECKCGGSDCCIFKSRAIAYETMLISHRTKTVFNCEECKSLRQKLAEFRVKVKNRKSFVKSTPPRLPSRHQTRPDSSLSLTSPCLRRSSPTPLITTAQEQTPVDKSQREVKKIQEMEAHNYPIRKVVSVYSTSQFFVITVDVMGNLRVWVRNMDQNQDSLVNSNDSDEIGTNNRSFEFFSEVNNLGNVSNIAVVEVNQTLLVAVSINSNTIKLLSITINSDPQSELIGTVVPDDGSVISLAFESSLDVYPRLICGMYQKLLFLRTDPNNIDDVLTVSRTFFDHQAMSFTSLQCFGQIVAAVSTSSVSLFDLRTPSADPSHRLMFGQGSSPLVVKNLDSSTNALLSVVMRGDRFSDLKILEKNFDVQTSRSVLTKVLPFKSIPKFYFRTPSLDNTGGVGNVLCVNSQGNVLYHCVDYGDKFGVLSKTSFSFNVADLIVSSFGNFVVVITMDGKLLVYSL